MKKVLICGTRKKGYEMLVRQTLNIKRESGDFEIIEGCCPNSADKYAEEWAQVFHVETYHFPATSGNCLRRNIEMVELADEVIAFWDGFSYGTCHTVATALLKNKPVEIVTIK